MTASASAHPNRAGRKRRFGPLGWTLVIVAALIAAFVFATQVYTDWLWFSQLGFGGVFMTETLLKAGVFVVTALLVAVPLWASMSYAVKHAEELAPAAESPQKPSIRVRILRRKPLRNPSLLGELQAEAEELLRDMFGQHSFEDSMVKYRRSVERIRKALLLVLPAVLGVLVATTFITQWDTVALFFNYQEFGVKDPEFGLDIGFCFYLAVSAAFGEAVLGGAGARWFGRHHDALFLRWYSCAARRYGYFICFSPPYCGAVVPVLAGARWGFWLDRYTTVQQQSGRWAGAMYTDTNSIIPVKAILAISAVLVAVFFLMAASTHRWRLPLIGTAMLVIVALVAGGVYPWIVQRFQVVPNEQAAQSEFIQRNIDATRYAYGLDKVETTPYDATINTAAGGLSGSSPTIENIRLLDPNVVSSAFAQMQQFRPYYRFDTNLAVDRYSIDKKTQDTVIAARELNPSQTSGSPGITAMWCIRTGMA